RRDVLHAQAAALGLPLIECGIEWPSGNEAYESAHASALGRARERWPLLRHCAFGDLFLEDVRAYRERQLMRDGWIGVFPLWGEETLALAHRFVEQGHRAVLTCVDTTQLAGAFSGREYDATLLAGLPEGVDPCGERGEFHTLSHGGPMFAHALRLKRGESVLREQRFQYTDFLLEDARP
ncbi:MAG: ATP-binding protein, partial [Rhodanobacteraceae bacterium]